MTFLVRDLNNFMTVQDFPFLLLWMFQDFFGSFVSASIRVFLLFASFVEAQFYVFKFSRYTSRRSSYRSAQLSGSGLFYIKHHHVEERKKTFNKYSEQPATLSRSSPLIRHGMGVGNLAVRMCVILRWLPTVLTISTPEEG